MIIEKIELFPLRYKYPQVIYDARSKIINKSAFLIKISADNGLYGWWEAATFWDIPEVMKALFEYKLSGLILWKKVEPKVISEYLFKVTAHYWQKGMVVSAISAIDIALWDLLAKEAKLSVTNLLGWSSKKIKVYASTWYFKYEDNPEADLDSLLLDLKDEKLLSFSWVKIKIWKYSLENDIERVKLTRETIWYNKILIVDANNSYSVEQTLKFAKEIEKYNIMFIEEPIEFWKPIESSRLCNLSKVPIWWYELDCRFEWFEKYIDNHSVDYIQPDVIWSWGISECIMIWEKAKRNLIALVPHNFSTALALSANIHVLNVSNAGEWIEFDYTKNPFMDSLDPEFPQIIDWFIEIKDTPWLWIEPQPGFIQKYLIK